MKKNGEAIEQQLDWPNPHSWVNKWMATCSAFQKKGDHQAAEQFAMKNFVGRKMIIN